MSEEFVLPDERAIEACLDTIRPYIQHDGGDVELLGIDEHGVVYVTFRGACAGCMMAAADFSEGIKLLLMDEVPNIRDVMLVG
ncbi:NifU family protein [Floccifex sp.]|uniref:NifU family protein n=1 Tax=Floccifex sp. TaxID=2815810 RepID=UPI003F110BA6